MFYRMTSTRQLKLQWPLSSLVQSGAIWTHLLGGDWSTSLPIWSNAISSTWLVLRRLTMANRTLKPWVTFNSQLVVCATTRDGQIKFTERQCQQTARSSPTPKSNQWEFAGKSFPGIIRFQCWHGSWVLHWPVAIHWWWSQPNRPQLVNFV